MLDELQIVNQKFISLMRKEQGVLGAWYFGSVSHDNTDKYSDIDIVFLSDGENFQVTDKKLIDIMERVCDEVVIEWAEDFNSDAIKNYCYLLKLNGHIFQYDVFLLNKNMLDDFMCRVHYAGLRRDDIIFDVDGNVEKLLSVASDKSTWNANYHRLIQTYWFHIHMTAKYFARKDFFKLNHVLRILMDTHTSLLLTALDKISWGGSANKLYFIASDKQQHLQKYGCTDNFSAMAVDLLQSLEWFQADVEGLCYPKEIEYSKDIGKIIKKYWINQMETDGYTSISP